MAASESKQHIVQQPSDNSTTDSTTTTTSSQKPRCPYKYTIIICCFFNVMFSLGVNRSIVVYLSNFQQTFALNEKKKVMFVVFPMICGGLFAPVAAKLCKKYTTRVVCVCCSLLGSISWFAAVFVGKLHNLGLFLTFVAFAGLFHGGVLVNAPIEVNRWVSPQSRAKWNAVVWAGSSFGALWIGPVFKAFIPDVEDGWFTSLGILVGLQAVMLLFTSWMLREPSEKENTNPEPNQKCSFKKLWKFRLFRIYLSLQIFYGLWRSGTTVYLVNYWRS